MLVALTDLEAEQKSVSAAKVRNPRKIRSIRADITDQ
jgi:hypothetical protein